MQNHKKLNRLLISDEIAKTLKMPGRKTSHLSFHFNKNDLQTHSRLGLAIPKRNAKRAIDRNRIKRLIRENFRKDASANFADVVVKLNKQVGLKTKHRLREKERIEIRKQIQQIFLQ